MFFALMALTAQAPAAAAPCPIDQAVYRLRPDPAFTAGFVRQDRRKVRASDLVLWLRTPRHTYFFSFESPNGYGGTYIVPDIDPRAAARMNDAEERATSVRAAASIEPLSLEFDAFEADLDAYEGPPQSGQPAPSFLFARALGPALNYDWTGLAAGNPAAVRESIPIGMFERIGCGGPP